MDYRQTRGNMNINLSDVLEDWLTESQDTVSATADF